MVVWGICTGPIRVAYRERILSAIEVEIAHHRKVQTSDYVLECLGIQNLRVQLISAKVRLEPRHGLGRPQAIVAHSLFSDGKDKRTVIIDA